MSTVIRIESDDLASTPLEFSDQEVDVYDISPRVNLVTRMNQSDDVRQYRKGGIHFEAEIDFIVSRYDTLLKLWELFNLVGSFDLYPHLPNDQVTRYTMIWMNPNSFLERWRRGYPVAGVRIRARFREPRGSLCFPPS